MKIKVGDLVKVTSNVVNTPNITIGKTYEVEAVSNDGVFITSNLMHMCTYMLFREVVLVKEKENE